MSSLKNTSANDQADVARLRDMVKQVEFCMLTTIDEHGNPHSRPMSTNKQVDFDGDLWFFTYASSHKADEVGRTPMVNASFADPNNQTWVSMTGRARIVRDRAKMEQLWQPQLKAWFPKGLDEPDIALLNVDVERAEYWDSPSSTIAHAYSLASSLVTGKPANPGENREVNLHTGASQEGSAYRQHEQAGGERRSGGGGMTNGRSSAVGTGSSYDSDLRVEGRAPTAAAGTSPRTRAGGGDGKARGGMSPAGFVTLLVGGALGAAAMYLLDPERGRTRRAYLGDKATALSNRANQQLGKTARDLSNRARGLAAKSGISLPSKSSRADGGAEELAGRPPADDQSI